MLNYKTVIVLKLVQCRLILANSAYGLVSYLSGDIAIKYPPKRGGGWHFKNYGSCKHFDRISKKKMKIKDKEQFVACSSISGI